MTRFRVTSADRVTVPSSLTGASPMLPDYLCKKNNKNIIRAKRKLKKKTGGHIVKTCTHEEETQ